MIYKNVVDMIGNTPLYKVKGYDEENRASVYIKLEKYNPGGSIKDRAALGMIEEAIKSGDLKKGTVIVEPTSGNTGIALAMIGASLGYRVIIIMPESLSIERRSLIKAYGAELVLTDGLNGMTGAIAKALKLKKELKENVFIPQQFENEANPNKHTETTAKEIFKDIKNLHAFVCGVGTGGTITGFGNYAKKINSKVKIYAVDRTDNELIFYVDGKETWRYKNMELEDEEVQKQYPFTKYDFDIILNFSLGGLLNDNPTWPGEIVDEDLPGEMWVDWVKVTKL